MNENTMIEVEVKISKADIKAEFSDKNKYCNKYKKHYKRYNNAENIFKTYEETRKLDNTTMNIPNLFYVAVPQELLEFAKAEVNKINPKYGVITVKDGGGRDCVFIMKDAKKLHTYKPNAKTVKMIGKRCSSELCTLRSKFLR